MRAIILTCLTLFTTSAVADTNFFAGAGVGLTSFDSGSALANDPAVTQLSSNELGYKLFLGYELGTRWAIEGGYIDFGTAKEANTGALTGTSYEYGVTGLYLNGQYHLPVSDRFSLDLVFGWLFAEADAALVKDDPNIVTPLPTDSFDDTGLTLGLAATWRTTDSIYVRFTADGYAIDFDNTLSNPLRLGVDLVWDF